MRLVKRKTDIDYEVRLLSKWGSLLNYSSKNVTPVPEEDRNKLADLFEQVETRYHTHSDLLKLLIPLVRRHGDLAYFEEGIYTPTEGQPNYGISFPAVKLVNPDQNESRFIAVALDNDLSGITSTHSFGFGKVVDYGYIFDF